MYGDQLNTMAVYNTNLSHKEKIQLTTIDAFSAEKKIDCIDFLKIDIEGNELEALRGASRLINQHKIGMIQFEFNVADIAARVFMKDFYDLLNDHHFYRIKRTGLLPLGPYSAQNEIFRIQNILAVSSKIYPEKEFQNLVSKLGVLFDLYGRRI